MKIEEEEAEEALEEERTRRNPHACAFNENSATIHSRETNDST